MKKSPTPPLSRALGSIAFDLDQHPPIDFLGRPFASEEVEKMKALLRQNGVLFSVGQPRGPDEGTCRSAGAARTTWA